MIESFNLVALFEEEKQQILDREKEVREEEFQKRLYTMTIEERKKTAIAEENLAKLERLLNGERRQKALLKRKMEVLKKKMITVEEFVIPVKEVVLQSELKAEEEHVVEEIEHVEFIEQLEEDEEEDEVELLEEQVVEMDENVEEWEPKKQQKPMRVLNGLTSRLNRRSLEISIINEEVEENSNNADGDFRMIGTIKPSAQGFEISDREMNAIKASIRETVDNHMIRNSSEPFQFKVHKTQENVAQAEFELDDNIIVLDIVLQNETTAVDTTFSCNVCNMVFTKKSDRSRHMTSHTGETQNGLLCEFCDKWFPSNSSMTRHVRIHTVKNFEDFSLCKLKILIENFHIFRGKNLLSVPFAIGIFNRRRSLSDI